jgi:nitrate reductase gamma subunit
VLVDRLKYISTGADYFVLILIGLIAITGLVMKFSFRADITSVKEFMVSLISLSPVNIPMDPVFILHLTLVLVLMAYFPFSKLIHMGGVFFSPSRNQVDNSRDVRHVNPWAKR